MPSLFMLELKLRVIIYMISQFVLVLFSQSDTFAKFIYSTYFACLIVCSWQGRIAGGASLSDGICVLGGRWFRALILSDQFVRQFALSVHTFSDSCSCVCVLLCIWEHLKFLLDNCSPLFGTIIIMNHHFVFLELGWNNGSNVHSIEGDWEFYGLVWGPSFCQMLPFMVDGNNSFPEHLWNMSKQLQSLKVRPALVLVSGVRYPPGEIGQND